jgi:hypothetical protein
MVPDDENEVSPIHICDSNPNPIIHYVAYNGRKLLGFILGYDAQTSYTKVDIVIFTNMSNVNGVKNFGMQFHQDIEYSDEPIPGTWTWVTL